jgi:hypothetical protein
MKLSLIASSLFFFLISCAGKSEKLESVSQSVNKTPVDAVTSFKKAMHEKDSITIENLIANSAKGEIVRRINSNGGFKAYFHQLDSLHTDLTITGTKTDSTLSSVAKVMVKWHDTQGSVEKVTDSVYMITVKEDGGWKLTSLYPQYEF